MHLLDLPNEILIHIVSFLRSGKQINRFARTCRQLYPLVLPLLCRYNIKFRRASGLRDMFVYINKHNPVDDREKQLAEFLHPSDPPAEQHHGFPIPVSEEILLRDKIIQRFVEYGADLTDPQLKLVASMHETALWGLQEMFWLLAKYVTNVSWTDPAKDGYTLLHSAAIGGNVKILRFLIEEKGLDVHARDLRGLTPLHLAAGQGNGGAIRLLSQHGADVDALDRNSWTPLHHLVMEGKDWYYTNARTLVELGADPSKGIGQDGKTALHLAVVYGREMAIDVLLESGLEMEARTRSGETPLYVATRKGLPSMMRMLLERGADLTTRDNDGHTLAYAAAAGEWSEQSIPVLMERGFTVHSDLGNGQTLRQHLNETHQYWLLSQYYQE